jgi:hypothetical protein
MALQSIDTVPPVTPSADDPGRFQDVKVPRRGRPTVAEPLGQVSGRQFRPVVRKQLHDVASRLVRQRVENGRDLIE